MSLKEKILEHLQELPVPFQAEVLDFVEYLESKIKKGGEIKTEDTDWSELSLSFAMHGMENEYSSYSINDLKEHFT
jgi:hypothetical protein